MKNYPNAEGFYEKFGGQFVPDSLKSVLKELQKNFDEIKNSKEFFDELDYYNKYYTGRPSPLYSLVGYF